MLEKKRILIIDNEEDFCFFVKNNLERTSEFEVTTATEGEDGISLARRHNPDLILLDIAMPGMSGDKVADVLLNDTETGEIPIVFLTAIASGIDMEPGTLGRKGMHDFIPKPVTTSELIECIRKILC